MGEVRLKKEQLAVAVAVGRDQRRWSAKVVWHAEALAVWGAAGKKSDCVSYFSLQNLS